MKAKIITRHVEAADYAAWRPLWDGYNAFYGRHGDTALAEEVTRTTWARFLDTDTPVFAIVAEIDGEIVGITHYIFHRSTSRIELTCYLQDLYTLQSLRGKGVGRALIEAVKVAARAEGIRRVYWLTHETNVAGRMLYDKVATNAGFIQYACDV